MFLRRSIAVATIALAATGVSAAPAFAKGDHGAKHAAHAAKHHGKFVLVGTVTAADGGSITLTVKGGNQRDLRGTSQVVTVAPGASVQRNDADAQLSDVLVGDHVMVKGTKDGAGFTATKVRAEAPEATEPPKTPEG